MAKYYYTARTKAGELRKGDIEAASEGQVADLLRSKGLVVVSVETSQGIDFQKLGSGNIGGVPINEKVVFMRQLATMVGAGLPLIQSLEILQTQAQNKAFQEALKQIVEATKGGSGLADSMEKQKGVFDEITVNLIRVGEETGKLEEIFNRLADNMEAQRTFRAKVQGAMIYPIIIILVMIGVVGILLVTMVPQMTQMYSEFEAELPLPTQMMVWLSDILINYWWLVAFILAVVVGSFIAYRRSPVGRELTDSLILKIPVFGRLTRDTQVADFARTFELMISSGIDITVALEITSKSLSNVIFRKTVEDTVKQVEKGVPLAKPISENENFPLIVSQMIAVGEETGKVDVILGKLNEYYTEEVNHTVNNLTALLEPIILVVMGGVVGFIAIAIYLPIFQIGQTMGV